MPSNRAGACSAFSTAIRWIRRRLPLHTPDVTLLGTLGVSPTGDDNIVYDITGGDREGGWGHPTCASGATSVAEALPNAHPTGAVSLDSAGPSSFMMETTMSEHDLEALKGSPPGKREGTRLFQYVTRQITRAHRSGKTDDQLVLIANAADATALQVHIAAQAGRAPRPEPATSVWDVPVITADISEPPFLSERLPAV